MRRDIHICVSLLYAALLFYAASVPFFWPTNGIGFVAGPRSAPFTCSELMSSSGDANAMIIGFVGMSIPALHRVILMPKPMGRVEFGLFLVSIALSLGIVSLATLDCAEILHTMIWQKDFGLVSAYGAVFMALVLAFILRKTGLRAVL
jgi:hypothetical protein